MFFQMFRIINKGISIAAQTWSHTSVKPIPNYFVNTVQALTRSCSSVNSNRYDIYTFQTHLKLNEIKN